MPVAKRGPTGPKVDTLFSAMWAKYGEQVNANMAPYYLVRWGFREGFEGPTTVSLESPTIKIRP